MARLLLTVSSEIEPGLDEQIAQGLRPRADFMEMARGLGADLMDYAAARRRAGILAQGLEKTGGMKLVLAWACYQSRHAYDVILTDNEGVGIPFALLCQRSGRASAVHLMITHVLSVRKKMFFLDCLRVHNRIHTFFVYSAWQKNFIQTRWSLTAARVVHIPFMVDTHFFVPEGVRRNAQDMICSAGLESRDYPTLLEAVQGMDVRVLVAAASLWSKRSSAIQANSIAANVSVAKFSQCELRQVYAESRFVVVPLHSVKYQAGITTILEAMAMARAVICSRTPGHTEAVMDGETGLLVEPGDPRALRQAIEHLLKNPEEAERMGRAGRQRAEQMMSLDCYVERFRPHLQAVLANAVIS